VHPDTVQLVLRVVAVVPDSVEQPQPVVAPRIEASDRRMLPEQWLAKGNRKEKGTNSVLETYQFSSGGTASMVTARIRHQSVDQVSDKSRHKRPNRERTRRNGRIGTRFPRRRFLRRDTSLRQYFSPAVHRTDKVCVHTSILLIHIYDSSFPTPPNFSDYY